MTHALTLVLLVLLSAAQSVRAGASAYLDRPAAWFAGAEGRRITAHKEPASW